MSECFFTYPESYPIYLSRIICAIYAIYCLVIVTVNALLIASFFATKQSMRNTSNLLIVCLSISDFLIGAVLMPLQFLGSLWFDSKRICSVMKVSLPLLYFFPGISFLMMMLLAIDRYIHMNPNVIENDSKIAQFFRRPRIYILIFACLTISAIVSISLHFSMEINLLLASVFTTLCTISLIIMMPIFVAIYTRSYLRIRRFVADNPVYQNREEVDSNESPEYLKELFKTVFLLIVALMISYLPILALSLSTTILSLVNLDYLRTTGYSILLNTGYILLFTNSFINALIILYRNKESMKWLRKCLRLCCKKRKVEEEPRRPEVIVNIGIEDPIHLNSFESSKHQQ